jgi:Dolichyl-phosphate-mannose-protein mannosyltransferase
MNAPRPRPNRTAGGEPLRRETPRMTAAPSNRLAAGPLWVLFLTIAATTFVRLRLLPMPLERDEGEYAYAGQLILGGHLPYSRLYNMKWPGTYYSYALLEALFGQTIEGVHVGVLLVNVTAVVLVFFIARRLMDGFAAAASAVAYAVLSVGPGALGFAGHATHFVVVSALAGVLCLLKAVDGKRLPLFFLAGLFAGLAPIMKQPGIVFTGFVVACWAWREFRGEPGERKDSLSRGAVLAAGILAPFAVLFATLWASHTLGAFWLWTVSYARYYGAPLNGNVFRHFWDSFRLVVGDGILFWIMAAFALIALPRDPRLRTAGRFLLWLLVFSSVGVLFGLTFREHYFILVLPAVALLFGGGVSLVRGRWLPQNPRRALAAGLALVLVPLAASFANDGAFLFWMTPDQASRHIYEENPFIEAVGVADYIRARTTPDDVIAVLGSEPELYFYCRRPSATGFIYMYPLVEKQPYAGQFREQMIHEIEAARPKYVVFVNLKSSWLPPPDPDMTVANWFIKYQSRELKIVGLVEVDRSMHITYRWDPPDATPHDNVRNVMTVYERLPR